MDRIFIALELLMTYSIAITGRIVGYGVIVFAIYMLINSGEKFTRQINALDQDKAISPLSTMGMRGEAPALNDK